MDDLATAKEEKMLYVTMTSAGHVALLFFKCDMFVPGVSS